jgi:hypothetical protein
MQPFLRFDETRAPMRSALIGVIVIGTIMQTMFQQAWLLSGVAFYAAIHVLALGLIVPIGIALMTRRSPALVTTAAIVVSKVPMMLVDESTIGPVAFTGILVWLACTLPSLASNDLRRPAGERMRPQWWMPAVAFVLLSAPYVVRAAVADPDVPVGAATAMFTLPIGLILLGIWVPAFVTDLVGAIVARRTMAKTSLDNPVRP